ncbi:MAG: hypothetical protein HY741_22375 [Chloroflexi bacterium]|nr:hypothetical protein [Chloroflexota bacterium]
MDIQGWQVVVGIIAILVAVGIAIWQGSNRKSKSPAAPQINADKLTAGRDINIHLENSSRDIVHAPPIFTQSDSNSLNAQYERLRSRMPKLIDEMRNDVRNDDSGFVRRFRVKIRPDFPLLGGQREKRFEYYEETHEHLRNMLNILANEGYVWQVTHDQFPVYEMSDQFIDILKAGISS